MTKTGLATCEKLALIDFLVHTNGWDSESKIERIKIICGVEDSDD